MLDITVVPPEVTKDFSSFFSVGVVGLMLKEEIIGNISLESAKKVGGTGDLLHLVQVELIAAQIKDYF